MGFVAATLWLTPAAWTQPATAPEYEVKAGFLTTFTQYTTWPADCFTNSNAPILIGVLGENPFGAALEMTARAQQGGRPLQVRPVRTAEEAAQCHVVFISKAESRNEAAWLEALKDKPVLTIGESGQTLTRGGVLEFVIENKRVRYEASWPAMARAGLKIGAPMLASARKVHQPPTPSR